MSVLGDAIAFLTDGANWSGRRGILAYGQAHLWISVVAAMAAAIAVPPAVFLAHKRRWPVLAVAVVNIGRAIPSFAVVALVRPFSIRFGLGLGFWPTCVALVALGIPPIFTNAYEGIVGTPDDAVDAARGIGMSSPQVLRRVELPHAVPLLVTGLRVATVQIVATATLGALVGYECLGTFIIAGLARGSAGRPEVLAGAALVTVLALSADALIGRLAPRLAPWTRWVR
ncbi:MAG: ABC transporter permease [Ilumatobacteraceae bacterium]